MDKILALELILGDNLATFFTLVATAIMAMIVLNGLDPICFSYFGNIPLQVKFTPPYQAHTSHSVFLDQNL